MPETYPQVFERAVEAVSAPGVASTLTDAGLLALDMSDAAVSVASRAPGELGAALAGATVKARDALQSVLVEAGADIVGEALNVALEVVPYAGGFISALLSVPTARGSGYSVEEARYYCSRLEPEGSLRGPNGNSGFGTGPGGEMLPADLFVFEVDESGRVWQTELGQTLMYATETYGAEPDNLKMPPERRVAYRALRRAIERSWTHVDKPWTSKGAPTDGGALLWLVYNDMLSEDWDAGRLSRELVLYRVLLQGALTPGHEKLEGFAPPTTLERNASMLLGMTYLPAVTTATKPPEDAMIAWASYEVQRHGYLTVPCVVWNRTPVDGVANLVTIWKQTISPSYAQFPSLEEVTAEARARFDAGEGAPRAPGRRGGSIAPLLLIGGAGVAAWLLFRR